MDYKLQNILDQIRIISKKLRERKQWRYERGDYFNIFQNIGIMSDEVNLHSSFIATLLNPNGNHGQKGKYLKAFIEMLNEIDNSIPSDFIMTESDKLSVQVEEYIGNGDNCGRIDIDITDGKNGIIIENKIYTEDQKHQMEKYWSFGVKKYGNDAFKLIYLTLDGKTPNKISLGSLDDRQYICISYKYNIISWLERCLELSSNLPLIRETIIQYINTIKILTNSNMEKNDEMLQILCNENNIDAVVDIFNCKDEVYNYIINKEFIPKMKELAYKKGFYLIKKNGQEEDDWQNNWMTQYAAALLRKNDWKYFDLSFEFNYKNLGGLIFGFRLKVEKERKNTDENLKIIWDQLHKCFGDQTNDLFIHRRIRNKEGNYSWYEIKDVENLRNGALLNKLDKLIDDAVKCANYLKTQGLQV